MTVQLLECVLDMIEVPSLFLDVHLLLQSYELLYGVMGHDIAIDVIIRACDGTVGPHTKADRDLDIRYANSGIGSSSKYSTTNRSTGNLERRA